MKWRVHSSAHSKHYEVVTAVPGGKIEAPRDLVTGSG